MNLCALLFLSSCLIVQQQHCDAGRKTLLRKKFGKAFGPPQLPDSSPRLVGPSAGSIITTTTTTTRRPNAIATTTRTATNNDDDEDKGIVSSVSSFAPCPCDVTSGCRCVQFYLCLGGTITSSGFGILRKRAANSCTVDTEVCCPQPSTVHEASISVPSVVLPEFCGTRRRRKQQEQEGSKKSSPSSSSWTPPSHTFFAEFPWTVLILGQDSEPLCSGALVHRKAVVTAAHCVDEVDAGHLKVVAGDWDYRSSVEPLPRQERRVRHKVIHEEYDGETLANDLALLILADEIKASATINVVCLPRKDSESFHSDRCLSTGWGKDENSEDEGRITTMKKTLWTTVQWSETSCAQLVEGTPLDGDYAPDKGQLCARAQTRGEVCQNDVGSPLVCPDNQDPERHVLVGLSYGKVQCGGRDVKELFVRIPRYTTWIRAKVLAYN